MPKTKTQGIVFGWIMSYAMAYGMEVYNITIMEGFTLKPGGRRHRLHPLCEQSEDTDCAATELNGNTFYGHLYFPGIRTDTIQGQVHDEKSYYAMAGVSGHAGLFASAGDLATLSMVMLSGGYGSDRFFSKDVLDAFTSPKSAAEASWAIGWWREADLERVKYFGTQSSRSSFGHEGRTGTMAVIDPEEILIVVFLTNKRNSRITDPAASLDQYDGNWYTTASLGFVTQLIYQAMDSRGGYSKEAACALLQGMLEAEMRTVSSTDGLSASHPLVKAARAIAQVLAEKSKQCSYTSGTQYAKQAEDTLDQIQ